MTKTEFIICRHGETKPEYYSHDLKGGHSVPKIVVLDHLTEAGILEIKSNIQHAITDIELQDSILIIHSDKARACATAAVINEELLKAGFDHNNIVIDESDNLGEVANFNWELFSLLISGGEIKSETGKSVTINGNDVNPDSLSPNDYYQSRAWEKIKTQILLQLPHAIIDFLEKLEPYEDVEDRITYILDSILKLSQVNPLGNNKKLVVILCTHDALTFAITSAATTGQITGLNTGGIIQLSTKDGKEIDAEKIIQNGHVITCKKPVLSLIKERQKRNTDKVLIEGMPSQDQMPILWDALFYDLKNSILASTNLGIYSPNLNHPNQAKKPKWLVYTRGTKKAVIFIYKNYRLFLSGHLQLLREMIVDINDGLYFDLPNKLTIVAPRSLMTYPKSYQLMPEQAINNKTRERTNAYERRFWLQVKDGEDRIKPEQLNKPNNPSSSVKIRKLNTDDLDKINQLLTPPAFEGGNQAEKPQYLQAQIEYTDEVVFYDDRLLNGLPYFGLFDENDNLISLIGTHGLVPEKGILCIGDAFTIPGERNKGYSSTLIYEFLRSMINEYKLKYIAADMRYDKKTKTIFTKLGFSDLHYLEYIPEYEGLQTQSDYIQITQLERIK